MHTCTRAVWAFDAIGTAWSVETDDPLDDAARAHVSALIHDFDRSWSRFRDDSLVAALARAGGTATAPPDASPMLDLYVELDAVTSGAVNPLVGDALERLGYDARYAFTADEPLAAPARWRERLTWDDTSVRLERPATIDVGALGKGRLVDIVREAVAQRTTGGVVVDASGDIAIAGCSERIGLEHPVHRDRAIGVWEIADAALCASATNRRAWGEGLHHILDARTGAPVRAYSATWAVAETAMRADALATALFFDGGAELAATWDAQWVRMRTDGTVEWSPGCTAEVFT